MLNRECPKCGDILGTVRHNRVLDQMQLECRICKYEWTLKPLDVLRADKERAATHNLPDHPSAPPCICTAINEPNMGGMRTHPNCPQHGYLLVRNTQGKGADHG